jgi:NADPH:quinone reductase-like Zn-dependent oxidoreductase
MLTKRDSMAVLLEFLEAGKLMPLVDRTYSLSELPEALGHLQDGITQGKIVITV